MEMGAAERDRLTQEIQSLKKENESLMKTVKQLNTIVNRLISRYIICKDQC